MRFAVHRPGIPEASPRSHGVPRRDVPGRVHVSVAGVAAGHAAEQGLALAASQGDVRALLEEVDQLQLVAQAATSFAPYTLCGLEEPQSVLRNALRAWKT